MTAEGRKSLLVQRFLEDCGYQSTVRQPVVEMLATEGHWEACLKLDGFRPQAEELATKLLRKFAKEKLPFFQSAENLQVRLPWNRTFECELSY